MIDRDTTCPPGIPEHLWDGLKHYVLDGRPTGQFLEALFSNDLFEVYARGDDKALAGLKAVVVYLYNNCPSGCYGSPEHVKDWMAQGGMPDA